MVVVFLGFVAIVALATSFQSSSLRRMGSRSHLGFEAIELCDSAINEAAAKVTMQDVFPADVFKNTMKDFCIDLFNDDKAKLDANYPGYKMRYRAVLDRNTQSQLPPPRDWIFISMTWPKEYQKKFKPEQTIAAAALLPGLKTYVAEVWMRPLSWRRDYAGQTWQNWGVLRYETSVTLDDGTRPVTRTMFVDRMFTVPAAFLALNSAGQPIVDPVTGLAQVSQAATTWLDLGFQKSNRNLKTVIKRS